MDSFRRDGTQKDNGVLPYWSMRIQLDRCEPQTWHYCHVQVAGFISRDISKRKNEKRSCMHRQQPRTMTYQYDV